MKVLVTGGTGFTGGHLAKRLLALNNEVRVLARSEAKAEEIKKAGAEVVVGDIRDRDTVFKAVKGVEKVYHVAAAYREAYVDDNFYWDTNYKGSLNVFDACLEYGIKRLVHTSTIGVVTTVKNPPSDENEPHSPGDAYQQSKCRAEMEALKYAKEKNLPVSVLRPAAIYGPGDMRLLKMFKMIAKRRWLLMGNGQACFHMVYIDNLVDGYLLCGEKNEAIGEVFIIGDSRYASLNELSGLIAQEFGVNPPKIHIPYMPVYALAALVEGTYKLFKIKKQPPIFKRRVAFFKKNRAFSIEKARNVLGYEPKVDMKTGIHLTAKWYLENGFIKI
ncbi:MAG: NAD-dependent epimerase/dehydratase family protein [Actinomycetota bacterium]|nr:NAD-dependent epimerase/dehydratase family protein [Actinomycetota bacterium]